MRITKLSPLAREVVQEIVRRGKEQTVESMFGLHYAEEPDRVIPVAVLRAAIAEAWVKGLLEITSRGLPFTYKHTLDAERVAKIDKQLDMIEKLRKQYGEVRTAADPGHRGGVKRILVLPIADGKEMRDEARWVYASGVVRRANDVNLDAMLGENQGAAA